MQDSNHPRQVLTYFALLLIIANLVTPSGSLAQISIQFYLKDHLKLGPQESAQFSLLMFVPVYGAFLFGLVRDRWWPLGIRDRGFLLVFAPLISLAYVFLAFRHETYGQMLIGSLAITLLYRLIGPSVAGLTATVGNRLQMTGRLSSLVQFVGNVIVALLAWAGGWISGVFSAQSIFLGLAAASLALFGLGFWKPAAIFRHHEDEPKTTRNLGQDLLRLVTHRPLWPAVAITLIWSFGPGQGTPLLYHLTNTVGMSNQQFGIYNMIGALAFVPGLLLYGTLCRKVAPRKLLIWATVFAVPQMIPLTYISSPMGAFVTSAFVGSVGGMAAAAYYDLLLRSCPTGLEATTVELGITGAIIADRFGNRLGAWLYERGGFALCNWITAAAYALILPLIFVVPRSVLAHTDSEPTSASSSAELAGDIL